MRSAHHLLARKGVFQGLQQEVTDHALCLGHEGVEGVGEGEVGVPGALECQQAYLGAIAVGDDQVVIEGEGGKGLDGRDDVRLLPRRKRNLTSLHEGVPTQGDDHPHRCPPSGGPSVATSKFSCMIIPIWDSGSVPAS